MKWFNYILSFIWFVFAVFLCFFSDNVKPIDSWIIALFGSHALYSVGRTFMLEQKIEKLESQNHELK